MNGHGSVMVHHVFRYGLRRHGSVIAYGEGSQHGHQLSRARGIDMAVP